MIVIGSDDCGEVWYRKAPSDDLFDPTDTGEDPEVHNEWRPLGPNSEYRS